MSHLKLGDMNYLLPSKKWGCLEWHPDGVGGGENFQPLLYSFSPPCWAGEHHGVVPPVSALQCRDPPACMQDIGSVFFKLIALPLICHHPFFRHIFEGIYWQCTFKCSTRLELQVLCSIAVQIFHCPWNERGGETLTLYLCIRLSCQTWLENKVMW